MPHEVNDHVAGVAAELRALGHSVTVLAPSSRAADLRAGRRALLGDADAEVIALGPAVPISRRSSMGVPVGVAREPDVALARGGYDVVHGFEPGLPSLSYLALRYAQTIAVASFFSPERLGYPPGKAQREKLLGRIDALIASSTRRPRPRPRAVPRRLPDRLAGRRHRRSSARAGSGRLIVLEWRGLERPARARRDPDARRAARLGARRCCARGRSPAGPYVPRRLVAPRPLAARPRRRRRARRSSREAAIFVPAIDGQPAASARGGRRRRAVAASARRRDAAGARGRRRRAARRGRRAPRAARRAGARAEAERQSFAAVAAELDSALPRPRPPPARRPPRRRPARRPPVDHAATCTCTRRWSHDCSIQVQDLLDHAESIGLGAIAVTDHNRFGGAQEAVELARSREPDRDPRRGGEDRRPGRGDRALPRSEEIPRGLPFADTIAAIRAQDGLVYLPHPFDRMHAIPDPRTLHRHLADIDVFEVYNARLLRESFNDEALRFARKYDLTMGAGSDAHVLLGRRHRRGQDACVRRARRSSWSACAAPRSSAARSR